MANNPNAIDNLIPLTSEKARELGRRSSRKGIPNARTRYARILGLVQDVVNPVTGKTEKFTVMEQIDLKLFQAALKGDIRAIDKINDRLEGKAQQALDITTGGEAFEPVTVRIISEPTRDTNTPGV